MPKLPSGLVLFRVVQLISARSRPGGWARVFPLAGSAKFWPCRLDFVRYADDCNIYVRSERAGQRVMDSITRFITQKLKLKINEAKSAVARPQERKFLGFSFTAGPEIKRMIAPKSLERFKQRIR